MSTDTVTVKLSKPIVHDAKTISELVFKECTAGDACLSDAVQGENTKLLAILSGMSGQPLQVLKQLPMRDYTRVLAATAPLMGEPQAAADGSTL
ncbi:phage tail assembly protein [Rhodopseudomonas sp. NSM]|uniref:phage tail assembly protein n=1 Tax=Rhodopseudomonas sp. NSM TaxID=3457630 RepID=UPI0040374ADA